MDFGIVSYLTVFDYYSKWIEFNEHANKCADEVIIKLKTIFSRFGVPNTVISDNISINMYIYKQFTNDWDLNYAFLSPHYSQSNVMANRTVGIAKKYYDNARGDRKDNFCGIDGV